MSDLFDALDSSPGDSPDTAAPLAAKMRPRSLDEFVGQESVVGPGTLLRRAIEADRLTSIILYGPPGVGKTTLAQVIASMTRSRVERLNAVESSVADLRRVLGAARQRAARQRTLLFIDEIHRFNRAQQDVLLPEVEAGGVRLVGATTQNPFFYLTPPLVSRSLVFELRALDTDELVGLMRRAISDPERGLGATPTRVSDEALKHLATISDGDARRALNALELAVRTTAPSPDGVIDVDLATAEQSIQRKAIVYDAAGDAHHDTISAFIKSIRGSDPDAALYWLAKMLHAGEDPRFIARRLVISSAEDIGMADPRGISVAVAAQQGLEFVGMPEGRILLAEATVYLATAPKSNRSYAGLEAAKKEVAEGRTLAVPESLRSASYSGAKRLGHGHGYLYSHDYEDAYVPQAYLPEGRTYYEPSERGYEKIVGERLREWRARFEAAQQQAKRPRKSE